MRPTAVLSLLTLLPLFATCDPGPIRDTVVVGRKPYSIHDSFARKRHRKHRRTSAIPADWALAGCFSDSSSSRALVGYSTTSSSLTPAACISLCANKGFSKSGVEYGQECYCSDSIAASTASGQVEPASDCSMACSGDASQACGNGDRIQIYSYAAPPPSLTGWTLKGCYNDDMSDRALQGFSQVSSTNTPASCLSACASKGYSFGGVEYGQECYCSNAITTTPNTGTIQQGPDCSMPCAGDSSQTCGAGGRIQIYQAASAATTTAPTSTSISTATTTSSSPSTTGAWVAQGCFSDDTANRALQGSSAVSSSNTPQTCEASCLSQGFTFAGVEFGQECYCANTLTVTSSTGQAQSAGDCSMTCTGDASQTCGSGGRISIYAYKSSTSSSTTASVTSTSVSSTATPTSTWILKGCYSDDTSDRALKGSSSVTSTNTPAKCEASCLAGGYTFAGVEYGQECYCSNTLSTSPSTGQLQAAGDCSMPCTGDASQACGNGGKILIYAYKSSTGSSTTASVTSTSVSSTATPTSTWVLKGCYSDDMSDRALKGTSSVTSTNTPAKCEASCLAGGYTFAGVEYGQECYCSNTLSTSSSTGHPQAAGDCSMPCTGDASQTCGNSGRIAIYTYTTTIITPPPPPTSRNPASVGYFINWGIYDRNFQPMNVPVSKLTHILYSFADISPSTGVVTLTDTYADQTNHYPTDSWNDVGNNLYGCFKQFYLLKKANRHLKVLLSIGGYTFSQQGHYDFVTDPAARATFVASSIQLLEDNGLDGIDIDFEYPTSAAQASGYASLLADIRTGLDAHAVLKGDTIPYELSAAVPAGPVQYQILDIADMEKSLTWWFIMAYDYAGSWSLVSDYQANLYQGQSQAGVDTDTTIKYYVAHGATPSKINLGIPLYARSFESTAGIRQPFSGVGAGSWDAGIYDYKALPRSANAQVFEDTVAVASYSYDSTTQELLSYDTPNIVAKKSQYVKANGLGGHLFWDLSSDKTDDASSLVNAAVTVLGSLDQTLNHLNYPGSQFDNIKTCMGGC